jgi:hypothetical protein
MRDMKTISALSIGAVLAAGAAATAYASPEKQLSGSVDVDCAGECPMPDPELTGDTPQCSPGFELPAAGTCVAPPDGYASTFDEPVEVFASNDGMDCLEEASEAVEVCSDEQEMCTQEYEIALL